VIVADRTRLKWASSRGLTPSRTVASASSSVATLASGAVSH
jgi:hypothetical protein